MPLPPRQLLIVALVALVAAGACSKGKPAPEGGAPAAPAAPAGTTAAPAPAGAPTLSFTITGIDSNGTQPPDDATVAGVKAALDRWAAAAVVAPLHTGRPAGDLSPVFTAPVIERLADPAVRSVLVDESLPPATKEITAPTAGATLSTVSTPEGEVAVVAAHLDFRVHAVGPSLDIDIAHLGEFVLVVEGDGWKIDSFAMQAIRDSRGD